jgi:dTDP-4-amino-4,6-dideoxygalactose transaminase/nucleoside-diphosphate-sugar epimerase
LDKHQGLAAAAPRFVLVGGCGFIGTAVGRTLRSSGGEVTVVDRQPPRDRAGGVTWIQRDLLTDDPDLPDGRVVLMLGSGDPRPRWPWTLALDGPVAAARLAPALAGRAVTLLSSVEVYGAAPAPLAEDTEPVLPWAPAELAAWCDDAEMLAHGPCPPWRAAALCRRLGDADPTGRWVYAMAKLAQERIVERAGAARLTVLRLANTYGLGQERVVARLVRAALAGRPLRVTAEVERSFLPVAEVGRILLACVGPGVFNVGSRSVRLEELARRVLVACGSTAPVERVPTPVPDSCGIVDVSRLAAAGIRIAEPGADLARFAAELAADQEPLFHPPLPVVLPPRPARPDEVGDRQQASLWTGSLKHGNRWSTELAQQLAKRLELDERHELHLTSSGTAALRLAIAAVAGPARAGQVAALPSFTFPATAKVLVQLGYRLRFVDVDDLTWTLDPAGVAAALATEPIALVVCVDTFGNPCDYKGLSAVCDAAGVPLLADSAAAIGSLCHGQPVARQAAAHAYSMSFAKVLSAGGAGGAVVLPAGSRPPEAVGHAPFDPMNELHAAAAVDQLAVMDDLLRRRAQVAAVYMRAARGLGLDVQRVRGGDLHNWTHFVMRIGHREAVAARMARFGVGTKPYFRALHRHELDHRPALLPVTDLLDAEALALPMSSELITADAERVVIALERCLG